VRYCLTVAALIVAGAYGIYQDQRWKTGARHQVLESLVTARTRIFRGTSSRFEEANDELSQSNQQILEVNQSLEQANESLAWANAQLTHSNRALEIRTVELRETLEANKEIIGVTAHDLKSPLSGILGLVDMIRQDLQEAPAFDTRADTIENIELVKVAAEQMLQTVLDLLDRHREGGTRRLRKEKADMNELILSVLSWNRQNAIRKGIAVHFLPSSEVIQVEVDILAIQRVIDNLISNAVKYSPPGTDIWITAQQESTGVRVQVRDEGPGLTEEDKKQVFGRLQRLSARPTAGEHSTGLGLWIVRQLVEEHGGQVGVASTQGKGATFWFRLDQSSRDAAPSIPGA
jgi:signal transduction histidine kinase